MRSPAVFLVLCIIGCVAMGSASAASNDQLAVLARTGNADAVKALLDAGADPNDYANTYSPLMFAAGGGHVTITKMLIAHRAKVDHRDHNGDRALLWAAQSGQVETVRLLLRAGAAVESADDPYRITPLMKASQYGHLAVAEVLIAAGADARHRDHTGDTALHLAAVSGNGDLVALLLRAGADPRVKSDYIDATPLHHAAEFGRTQIVRMLLRAGADVEARDYKGRTALWSAAALDDAAVVEVLLTAGADPDARDLAGVTPFVAAAGKSGAAARLLVERTRDLDDAFAAASWGRHGHLARRLAERGADINAVDARDRPALAAVALMPGTGMLDWFLTHNVDLDRHGAAALTDAAEAGRIDVLQRLLDAKVPVDARAYGGATALFHAARTGQLEVVRILLERGADRDIRDAQGRGVHDYMAMQTSTIDAIVKLRTASRAYHPIADRTLELGELADKHAAISALLAH